MGAIVAGARVPELRNTFIVPTLLAQIRSSPRCTASYLHSHICTRISALAYLHSKMEPSPLTQVSRPELFQPKIISLYETLFTVRMLPIQYNTATVAHQP